MKPDFSTPHGAVRAYDTALKGDSIDAILACFSFRLAAKKAHSTAALLKKLFLDDVEKKGIATFRRARGADWRYVERNEKYCVVRRTALMEDGCECEEDFQTGLTKRGWRILRRKKIVVKKYHPLLGAIVYDTFFWHTHRYLDWLGHVVGFSLEADERNPSAEQCSALCKIVDYSHDLRDYICEEVFRYYNEYVYGRFVQSDEHGNEISELLAPPVVDSSEMWGMIWPSFELAIEEIEEESSDLDFSLNCACQWDEEHGLGMRFKDWKIVEVGGSCEV